MASQSPPVSTTANGPARAPRQTRAIAKQRRRGQALQRHDRRERARVSRSRPKPQVEHLFSEPSHVFPDDELRCTKLEVGYFLLHSHASRVDGRVVVQSNDPERNVRGLRVNEERRIGVTVVLLEDNVGAVTREMVKEKYGVVTRERIGRAQFYNGESRYRGLSRDRSRDQPTVPLQ